jgi:hypothetical protein
LKYFAYGSNMCTAWLRARVPSAEPVAVARLHGHSLRFHKAGRDGSAKCDAFHSSDPEDEVVGVVFEIEASEKPALDFAEGLGNGYSEVTVCVEARTGWLEAFTYRAQATHVVPALLPYDWYKALVIRGAQEHGLAPDYIRVLERAPQRSDPEAARAVRARRLLGLE